LAWPEHPDFPPYGYVVRRRDLDAMVANRAVKAGATLWTGTEADNVIVDRASDVDYWHGEQVGQASPE